MQKLAQLNHLLEDRVLGWCMHSYMQCGDIAATLQEKGLDLTAALVKVDLVVAILSEDW